MAKETYFRRKNPAGFCSFYLAVSISRDATVWLAEVQYASEEGNGLNVNPPPCAYVRAPRGRLWDNIRAGRQPDDYQWYDNGTLKLECDEIRKRISRSHTRFDMLSNLCRGG